MGVRGLTTYVNAKQDCFLKYHLLHDTSLVIDGHSLSAQLYACLNCFSAFGGDYDKYAAYVKKFFARLKKCKVTCYVLFDGSYESRKLKTAFSRLRSKIYGASRLDAVTQSSMSIFPLFLRDVFKNVLIDLQIPYTICEFEADDEIAAMARHLECPVLSYDSDFFIYNTLYIPFKTLDTEVTVIEENGERKYGLECRLYKMEYMLEHFGGLKKEMLPLLATLLGNDFVEKKLFRNFFSQLKLPKSRHKTNEQQRSIHGLLKWLREESLDSAITKIIGRLKKQHKNKVLCIIKKSIQGYETKYCRSLKYFGLDYNPNDGRILVEENNEEINLDNIEVVEELDEVEEYGATSNDSEKSESEEEVETEYNMDLPQIIIENIRSGSIPQSYTNLYTHRLYFCSPQAEDHTQMDSFTESLPILQFGFNILTNFSGDSFIYVSRNNNNYSKLCIENDSENPFDDCKIPLEAIDRLPQYFKHFIKEHFCNLDLNLIEQLPANYRIFMLSILWWVANCKVPVHCVHSLFLCYIMLEVIDEKTGMYRGHNFFNTKHSKKLEQLKKRPGVNTELKDLFLNKNKVSYDDCLLAASQLLGYFELSNEIKKHPSAYDRRRMHTYAQFQCCLQQINYLNTLCGFPYVNCKIYNCFNGTFVYNVSKKLELSDPLSHIQGNLLKGADTVLFYFKSLCRIFDQCVDQLNISLAVLEKKRGRRRKKRSKEPMFLHELFKNEVYI